MDRLFVFGCLMCVIHGVLMPLDHPGCILKAANGDICGVFGYINNGAETTIIAGDTTNSIRVEGGEGAFDMVIGNGGQPSVFKSGEWLGSFCAPFPDGVRHGAEVELTWTLGILEASISANDELCIHDEDWTWHPTLSTAYPTRTPSKHPTDEDGEPNIDTDPDYDVDQE